MKLLKAQLRTIKNLEARINPDHEWVLRNREKLMTQIAHTSKQSAESAQMSPNVAHSFNTWAKIFIPRSLAHSFKPALSVAVALIITTAGWIASAYAEPGDMFWGAKSAFSSVVESSRLALASDDEQTTLKLNYASKQAHILKQVIETENVTADKKTRLVEKTMNNFQKKFDSAQESIKTLDPSSAADLVKEVSLSTRDISLTLQEASNAASSTDAVLLEKIEKTATDVTAQSLEMVGETVAKKNEANLDISAEEEAIVKEHIDIAVESIVANALKAQDKLSMSLGVTSTIGTSTTVSTSASSSITNAEIATAIDEQKKTVNSLKETNLLEAINTTKILAEQVSTVISNQILIKEGVMTPLSPTSSSSTLIATTTLNQAPSIVTSSPVSTTSP